MLSIVLDDALADAVRRAAATTGQEVNNYAVSVLRNDAEQKRAQETHQSLFGPAQTLQDSDAAFRAAHKLPDLSSLSDAALDGLADAAIEALPPDKRAEAERLGLI